MDRIAEIMRLMLECAPSERAEVLRLIRGKMIETQQGLMTREDFLTALRASRTLNDAAAKLGISRRTLQYHMRLLGLPPGGPKKLDAL